MIKEYNVYDMNTDEFIGTVKASNVDAAEYIACGKFSKGSNELYALNVENI